MKCLDNKRLGKQRVEGIQIRRALAGKYKRGAWVRHPAVLMWKGYENYLDNYIILACQEWRDRGFMDSVERDLCQEFNTQYNFGIGMPPFVTPRLVSTHRANLYIKDPSHYSERWRRDVYELDSTVCCPSCNYFWPTHLGATE